MKTHAAQRTMSRRAAAGSRRNKRHKYVSTTWKDEQITDGWPPLDWRMAPNHPSRKVDIKRCFPLLKEQHNHVHLHPDG
jgi:hypothetical protein